MPKVKCVICGKELDYTKEQAVKSNRHKRRYSHYNCEPDGELMPLPPQKPKSEEQKIKDYAKQILGDSYNAARVNQQIKKFKKENNYSDSGILKSLIYWYEIKHEDPSKANGSIGIVPFIYQDAYNYYLSLFMATQANEGKDAQEFTSKTKEITIKTPVANISKHYFDFVEVEDE